MTEYSRRQLAMMDTKTIKGKYVTDVRLRRNVRVLKKALEARGVHVPYGCNPKSLL